MGGGSDPVLVFCFADSVLLAKISLDFFVLPLIAVLCGCIGTLIGSGHLFDPFPSVTLFGFDLSYIYLAFWLVMGCCLGWHPLCSFPFHFPLFAKKERQREQGRVDQMLNMLPLTP
jgi:hypothetical protein